MANRMGAAGRGMARRGGAWFGPSRRGKAGMKAVIGAPRQVTENSGANAMAKKPIDDVVSIKPLNFETIGLKLIGTAPYMQARFSAKAMQAMKSKMEAGPTAKKGGRRESRDFDDDFQQAQHISEDGWNGIPASAFRNACIDVCRMVGFKMTHAKMSIFVESDGLDQIDGTPLVKLMAGPPERTEMTTRNATGVADIRVRPLWRAWAVNVVIRFDKDQFTASDVVNLMARAGQQVGIGEGRPFSKSSN